MKQVDSSSQQLHLFPNSSYLVSASWQKLSDTPKLFCAVLDVPDLIVKVPEIMGNELIPHYGLHRTASAYFAR